MKYTQFESGICPACGKEVYKWFVEENGYCPADGCHHAIKVEELKEKKQ